SLSPFCPPPTDGHHYPRASASTGAASARKRPACRRHACSQSPLQAALSLSGALAIAHDHLTHRRLHLRASLATDDPSTNDSPGHR
ncbi:hypothetical protein BHE74_00026362, partial [Ensete ventricosum]